MEFGLSFWLMAYFKTTSSFGTLLGISKQTSCTKYSIIQIICARMHWCLHFEQISTHCTWNWMRLLFHLTTEANDWTKRPEITGWARAGAAAAGMGTYNLTGTAANVAEKCFIKCWNIISFGLYVLKCCWLYDHWVKRKSSVADGQGWKMGIIQINATVLKTSLA
jgi:hypothetical protein